MMNSLSQIFRMRAPCISMQTGRTSCFLRYYSTTDGSKGGSKEGKDSLPTDAGDVEEDDEFSIDGFEIPSDEDGDLDSVVEALSNEAEEITPELASDLVTKMVEAAKKTIDKPRHGGNIISHISPHTISVLRASRITTNNIKAAGSDYLPHAIEKRVTAEVNVDLLNLSRTAQEALKILSGPRWKGSYIKLSCSNYPSMQENRTHIVSQIDRLVAGAKKSVGEEVDTSPLTTWSDVVQEVNNQAKEEIEEAGGFMSRGNTSTGTLKMTSSLQTPSDATLTNSCCQNPALQQLQSVAKSIALSITSIVMSSRDELRKIKCLESAGVQNEDELKSILEKCTLECLLESKPKDRSPSVQLHRAYPSSQEGGAVQL